jgi:hypothetical protein
VAKLRVQLLIQDDLSVGLGYGPCQSSVGGCVWSSQFAKSAPGMNHNRPEFKWVLFAEDRPSIGLQVPYFATITMTSFLIVRMKMGIFLGCS